MVVPLTIHLCMYYSQPLCSSAYMYHLRVHVMALQLSQHEKGKENHGDWYIVHRLHYNAKQPVQ